MTNEQTKIADRIAELVRQRDRYNRMRDKLTNFAPEDKLFLHRKEEGGRLRHICTFTPLLQDACLKAIDYELMDINDELRELLKQERQ